MHDTRLTQIGSRSRRDPAVQIDVLHRLAVQLAERSTSAAVEMDITNELRTVFEARWVALYRSQPDGSLLRSAIAGNGKDTPQHIGANSLKLEGTVSIPAAAVALAGTESAFGCHALVASISHHEEHMGMIVLCPAATAKPLDPSDAKFLSLAVRIVAPHLFYLDALEVDRGSALTDSVTGLGNRRAFEERIGEELARSNRSGQQLALLVCAIDAPRGELQRPGDDAIRAVVDALKQSVRLSDPAFRTGERQFSALLTRSGVEGAMVVAKRIMTAAEELPAFGEIPLTLSIGVAALKAGVKHTPLDLAAVALTRKAENALRNAMELGGKRAVSA